MLDFLIFLRVLSAMWLGEIPRLGKKSELQPGPMPPPWQPWIHTASAAYTAASGNAGSFTHWTRPGIKATSSHRQPQVHNPLSRNRNSYLKYFIPTFESSHNRRCVNVQYYTVLTHRLNKQTYGHHSGKAGGGWTQGLGLAYAHLFHVVTGDLL